MNFILSNDDLELLSEINSNRDEGFGGTINISKLTENVIFDIAEKYKLDFESIAELLIHKGAQCLYEEYTNKK
ncbi:MAG: hypothetical protein J1F11_10240 [Oscillospiraceae bacterium]|nr:hypothetical protein [Oscillospiraceae bacterium]